MLFCFKPAPLHSPLPHRHTVLSLRIKTKVLKTALRPFMSWLLSISLTSTLLTFSLTCSIPATLSSLLFQACSCLGHTCPDNCTSLFHSLQTSGQIYLSSVGFPDINSCPPTPTFPLLLSTYHHLEHYIFTYFLIVCLLPSECKEGRDFVMFILCS